MNRRHFFLSLPAAAYAAPSPIGVAFYGTRHSHYSGKLKAVIDNPAYRLLGVCEPDPEAAAKITAHSKLSEEQLLNARDIQLVVVETPAGQGLPYGRKVIDAGKHLHIEKPPTREWEPFRRLVADAQRKNLLLQTGYIWRFHEGITRAIQAAKQGWLGDVYLMRGTIHTDIAAPSRRELAAFKGGMMFELGCHQIDRVVDLFGRPKDVKSWLNQTRRGKQDGLADATVAILDYGNAQAVITTSAEMPTAGPHRSFEVIGTEGAFVLQPVEPGADMRVNMRSARGPYQAGWQTVNVGPQPRYIGDFRDMARAIQTRSPLKFSYDFETLVQETVLRASQELV
ncbi:MAG: Gfo/Idh/MocA family oxidoreductase [Bryobacterales bacterium]|nr:Gfo/Idh/MocA family oxidoreductase [Bryobacterales bacterium]